MTDTESSTRTAALARIRRRAKWMTEEEATEEWSRWLGYKAACDMKPDALPSLWTQPTFYAAGVRLGKLT